MKKVITLLTICSMLFTTSFIYANNKEEQLDEKLIENRQEQQDVQVKIKNLDNKIANIEKNIEETNAKIIKLDSDIESTKIEIKKLEENILKNEELLGQRLKVINSNYSLGYMKVILSSTSLTDFFDNIYMVKQVVEQDKVLLKELDENKITVQEKEKGLETKKKTQEELKLSLQNDSESVKADKEELESLKAKLEKEESNLESEIEKLAAQSIVDVESGAVISSGSWPVPGYSRVSSPYGYRLHPVLNIQKMHTGIDIPAPMGTPTVAIDSGRVIFSGVQGSYGNTVMIQHDDGKVTLYAHNSALLVSVGQRVEKGQVVAKIGSSGRSTGPHLHFEVRINGKHTNPMAYIK